MLFIFIILACSQASMDPKQVHIAFAGKNANNFPTGYAISWWTDENTDSVVFYGTGNDASGDNVRGTSVQYLADHGFHHTVVLTELEASTVYYYKVGNSNGNVSPVFRFISPSNNSNQEFKMAIFGDLGYKDSVDRPQFISCCELAKDWSAKHSRKVLENWKNDGIINSVWHIGDIGYADDSFTHAPQDLVLFTYEDVYNGYMDWMENVTATLPYMVSPGNHESECHSPNCFVNIKHAKALSNFTAFNTRWHMPSVESNGNTNMWYSWNYGPVHFVSINTETNWEGAEEYEHCDSGRHKCGGFWGDYLGWLEADLKAAVADPQVTWIVAGGHRPIPQIGDHHMRLFDQYGVDIYFAGHAHSYARSYPVKNNVVDSKSPTDFINPVGTVYVVSGGAGCDEMAQGTNPNTTVPDGLLPRHSNVLSTDIYSMGYLSVTPEKLTWNLLSSETQQSLDHFSITKL